MTEGQGAKDAPPSSTDQEHAPGPDLFGLGERDRQATLAWVGENLTQVRRSVYEQRLLHWSLGTGLVVGLAVHVGGYVLRSSVTTAAAGAGGRPALCARLCTVDRGRGGGVRAGHSGGKTAAVQAGAGCLRGGAARRGPSRRRPGVGGRRSADGEVAATRPSPASTTPRDGTASGPRRSPRAGTPPGRGPRGRPPVGGGTTGSGVLRRRRGRRGWASAGCRRPASPPAGGRAPR
jgi:hypothetical protein